MNELGIEKKLCPDLKIITAENLFPLKFKAHTLSQKSIFHYFNAQFFEEIRTFFKAVQPPFPHFRFGGPFKLNQKRHVNVYRSSRSTFETPDHMGFG